MVGVSPWKKRLAVGLAAAALAAILLGRRERGAPASGAGAGLDVLLVTLDTTRADRLGCYGRTGARTPTLDRLAAEGVRFQNAVADAPITLPAHASLLTGLYPFEHGVRNNGNFYLADRYETLATRLRSRGYRTAAFVSSFILDRRYGLARGFETYDDRLGEAAGPEGLEAERHGDRTALALVRWLEAEGNRGPGPLFSWLHLYDAHEPYRPPPPFRELFPDDSYQGEIAFTDYVLETVLEKLARLRRLERTLVAIVADHGESLGDHGEETHSMFLYESAIRVPMILWRPGVVPRGVVVIAPVRAADLAPTLLDVLGEAPLSTPHARSLRRTIAGIEDDDAIVYAETYVPKLYMNGAPLRALRDGRFKLIDAPRAELYDLGDDPGETHDRFAEKPEIAAGLLAKLRALTAGAGAMSEGPIDGEAVERLKALGYLGAGGEMAASNEGPERKDPKDLIAIFNRLRRAEGAIRDRRFEDAHGHLTAVLAEEPRNAFAHMLLGRAYAATRQPARALAEFRAYAEIVPNSAQARHWIAVAYVNLGDQASALREAAAALALDPHLSDARVLRAGIFSSLGRRAEAVQELRTAVAADPHAAMLRLELAEVLLDVGMPGEAETEYRAILNEAPVSAPALAGLGSLLARRGDLEGASRALRGALEADPLQDEARFNLAGVLERQGRPAEARAEYERLVAGARTPPAVRDAAQKRLAPTRGATRP